ncbi:MAG: acetate uptake transporter [Acidimicrobiaceae bacterium]|nr:acetate uptake transporter [Acidimicrobiaceae bacterium]
MAATNMPREADVAPAPDPTAGRLAGWTPADPGPLGLAAFATTTFILSMINANLIGGGVATVSGIVGGMALAYGGIAQFSAGLWEFRTGNTFGATAFCSFGMFWVSFWFLLRFGAATIPASELFSAVGVYLWAWGIFTAYMFVASLRTTGAVALVLLLLAITFIVLGIGNSALAGTHSVTNGTIKLGGWIGLVTAIVAWYASFAGVTNATWGRTILPVFPLNRT